MASCRRRKSESDARRDVISELPADVKERILECLDTRDAARTALLSTHWNDVWLRHGRLVFDSDFFECVSKCEGYKEVESRWFTLYLKAIKTLCLLAPVLSCKNVEAAALTFPTAINLQVIELYDLSVSCGEQLTFVMQLLQKSPNLCELKITALDLSCSSDDIKAASRLLEDPNSCIINQDLKMLNTIKIEGFSGSTLEMLFVKMLLSKSPALERIVIQECDDIDASMVVKILRELLRFPRASPKAQIVCMECDSAFGLFNYVWF